MSDRVNSVTKEQERQGGAVSIRYSYEYEGETKSATRSIVKERLYVPGYIMEGEKPRFCNDELWAAFSAAHKGLDDVTSLDKVKASVDTELANSLIGAMDPEVVAHDDLAKKFYVKPGADFTALSAANVGITTGEKVIERETKVAKDKERAAKISDLTVKEVKLKDYSSELAEGATKVTHTDQNDKEWTKTFVNNRLYLTYSGETDKKELFATLAQDNDIVKRDGFAMNHFIDYDATREEKAHLLESNPGLNTTRGNRAADYMVDLCEKVDDLNLVGVEHLSSAAYTVMKEDYIKKAEAAKVDQEKEQEAEQAPEEQSQENEKDFDSAMSGPSRGR